MQNMLIGQVYNVETGTFQHTPAGANAQESRTWTSFRLGMTTEESAKQVPDGNGGTRLQREKTFMTCKAFGKTAELINQYFSGDENKGKWIQLFGYMKENDWTQTIEVPNPADPSQIFELEVPVKRLEFMLTSFGFIGNPPAAQPQAAAKSGGIQVKVKAATGAAATGAQPVTNPAGAQALGQPVDISDDDLPF